MSGDSIDPRVLQELDRWLRSKGGKVQSRLITEFYAKHPANKPALHERLYALADHSQSTVHVVLGKGPSNTEMEYLELKDLGNKPHRKIVNPAPAVAQAPALPNVVTLPTFIDAIGESSYAIVRDPAVVRAVLQDWSSLEPHAVDLKGDVRREGRLSLVQICNRHRQVLMIDFVDNLSVAEQSGLKAYLEDPSRLKIILDSARPVDALRGILGIDVRNVFDISRAQIIVKQRRGEYMEGTPAPTLVSLTRELGFPFYKVAKPEESWFKRPLNKQQLEYSLTGVLYNVAIYERVLRMVQEVGALSTVMDESARHMVSLKDVQFIEDDYGTDWSCSSCGFKNFSKRMTCRKCDHARPEQFFGKKIIPGKYDVKPSAATKPPAVSSSSQQPARPAAALSPNGTASASAAAPEAASNSPAEPLSDMEDEAIRLAMELSLRDERERQERASKDLHPPGDQSMERAAAAATAAKPKPGKVPAPKASEVVAAAAAPPAVPSKASESPKMQKGPASPSKPVKAAAAAAPKTIAPPAVSPSPALPSLTSDMFSSSSFFGAGSMAPFEQSKHAEHSHQSKPQTALPTIESFEGDVYSRMEDAQKLVANVIDDSDASRMMGRFPSFSSLDSSGNGSTWGQPLFSKAPLMGTPLYGFGPSVLPASAGQSSSLPSIPQQAAQPSPGRQQTPPLSEDEMVLLSTDVGALLEEIKLPEHLVRPVMEAAIRVGARSDIVEAPLPSLAKELEKLEITVGQRASILKGIHARKQKGGRS